MKTIVKKQMMSRKKIKTKSKAKSASTKKTTQSVKAEKRVIHSKTIDKQPIKPHTSSGKKGDNLPFKKNNKHGFQKGKSGNPKGRPKLGNTKHDNLIRKIRIVEHNENVNILEDFIKRSLTSETMAIALMKKQYPDLKSIEQITLAADSMSETEAADIRKEMRKRFETK